MDSHLLCGLVACETDVDGALRRFCGDEGLYVSCLSIFLEDTTLEELRTALSTQDWDGAFTAAHALKGLAGNMGFIPLFHAVGELVVLIRAGKVKELDASFRQVQHSYDEVAAAIRENNVAVG